MGPPKNWTGRKASRVAVTSKEEVEGARFPRTLRSATRLALGRSGQCENGHASTESDAGAASSVAAGGGEGGAVETPPPLPPTETFFGMSGIVTPSALARMTAAPPIASDRIRPSHFRAEGPELAPVQEDDHREHEVKQQGQAGRDLPGAERPDIDLDVQESRDLPGEQLRSQPVRRPRRTHARGFRRRRPSRTRCGTKPIASRRTRRSRRAPHLRARSAPRGGASAKHRDPCVQRPFRVVASETRQLRLVSASINRLAAGGRAEKATHGDGTAPRTRRTRSRTSVAGSSAPPASRRPCRSPATRRDRTPSAG